MELGDFLIILFFFFFFFFFFFLVFVFFEGMELGDLGVLLRLSSQIELLIN
jgi:hypothetical protein